MNLTNKFTKKKNLNFKKVLKNVFKVKNKPFIEYNDLSDTYLEADLNWFVLDYKNCTQTLNINVIFEIKNKLYYKKIELFGKEETFIKNCKYFYVTPLEFKNKRQKLYVNLTKIDNTKAQVNRVNFKDGKVKVSNRVFAKFKDGSKRCIFYGISDELEYGKEEAKSYNTVINTQYKAIKPITFEK